MSYFLIRAELHGARAELAYEQLHAFMAEEGIGRTIAGSDGITYQLPTGTYCIVSNAALPTVLAAAQLAANKTGFANEVIVGQCSNLTWEGLSPAKK